jgi:hypothetical protein
MDSEYRMSVDDGILSNTKLRSSGPKRHFSLMENREQVHNTKELAKPVPGFPMVTYLFVEALDLI